MNNSATGLSTYRDHFSVLISITLCAMLIMFYHTSNTEFCFLLALLRFSFPISSCIGNCFCAVNGFSLQLFLNG